MKYRVMMLFHSVSTFDRVTHYKRIEETFDHMNEFFYCYKIIQTVIEQDRNILFIELMDLARSD
jgi:hypothetical protein